MLVAVAQRDLLALVNLRPRPRHVDAVGLSAPVAPRAACRFEHEGPQPLRHGIGDLRHQVFRRARQHRVGVPDHPLRAEHRRLDLIGRQHQGRQVKTLLQDVAHAGFATDRYALADQGCDVAIDRALRGLKFLGDRIRGQRIAAAPQHLDDLKQPVGASHGKVSLKVAWKYSRKSL